VFFPESSEGAPEFFEALMEAVITDFSFLFFLGLQ